MAGGAQWFTLGQSYGGFITMSYLSQAPEGLLGCYVTGGLPGLTATADDVYARTFPRIAGKNREFYARYPDDVAVVRAIADHLDANDVRLPDGDRLTTRRLRLLGNRFGMSTGYDLVHWLLEEAWHGDQLSDGFLHQVMAPHRVRRQRRCSRCRSTPTAGPAPARPRWAAERAIAQRPEFAADADPLLFTGETMFPWMFEEIAALRPFRGAAELLASYDDWPPLYDLDRLAANEVPVAACVYFDDMYVDSTLQLETARAGRQHPGLGHQRVRARRPARRPRAGARPAPRHGRRSDLVTAEDYGPPPPVYAAWGRRAIGYLLDALLTSLFVLPGLVMVRLGTTTTVTTTDDLGQRFTTTEWDTLTTLGLVLAYLLPLPFFIWNSCIRQGRTGRTLGKQVVRHPAGRHQHRCTDRWLVIVRAAAGPHPRHPAVLPRLVLALWDTKCQTFADKVMDTVVVVQR